MNPLQQLQHYLLGIGLSVNQLPQLATRFGVIIPESSWRNGLSEQEVARLQTVVDQLKQIEAGTGRNFDAITENAAHIASTGNLADLEVARKAELQGQGLGVNYQDYLSSVSGGRVLSTAQLPQSAQQLLDVVQEKLTTSPPPAGITVDTFLQQAQTELGPYFNQLFQQAQQDLQTGFRQIGEDVGARELELGQQYGRSLENIQEDAARRGLTFSTIRNQQEKSLADQTQEAIETGRREAERRALELGTQGERTLGTANLPQLPNAIPNAPRPITGQTGVYQLQPTTGTRNLFAPVGNTVGKLESQRDLGIESLAEVLRTNRARELGETATY